MSWRSFPLATAGEIAGLSSFGSTTVYTHLGELRDAGLVNSASLGWFSPVSMRWFLTDLALSGLGRLGFTWHEEPARCRLLERLPSVEWFYSIAASVRGLGAFEAFHWCDNLSFRCGREVRARLGSLSSGAVSTSPRAGSPPVSPGWGPDLREMSVSPDSPWPGQILFVVNDQWQRELVYRASRRHYLEDQVVVWCARDGSGSGAGDSRPSRGWVYQPVRFLGSRGLELGAASG